MEEKHPFEDVFNQIGDLLKFVNENAANLNESDEIPPEVEKKLSKLEREVANFKKKGDQFIEATGIKRKELDNLINLNPEYLAQHITKEDTVIIKKAKEIKAKVEEAEKKFSSRAAEGKEKGIELQKYSEDLSGKKRKKKFKRFGSDKNWKPL